MERPNNTPHNGQMGAMPQLAMVYSPIQDYTGLYEPEQALSRGTLFRALDKPLEEDCR